MENSSKIKYSIHTLKSKIIILIFFCVIVSIASNSAVLVSSAMNYITDYVESSLLSLSISYGSILENNIDSDNNTLDITGISHHLANIDIKGTKSSYAYLVSCYDGNMIYHPRQDKIGLPVSNKVIKQAASDLKNGKTVTSSIVSYEFEGKIKYAAFYVSKDKNYILVLTVDKSEILSSSKNLLWKALITFGIILFLMTLIGYFTAASISTPIKKLTWLISQFSQLNFNVDNSYNKLVKEKGEVGMMASAIFNMHSSLRSIISDIENISTDLNSNSIELNNICNTLNSNSLDNCALSEQLSANMEETSATTELIACNVGDITIKAEDITVLTSKVENDADEILERASELKDASKKAAENSNHIYSSVTEKVSAAVEDFRIINDISELTATIKDIADQTSLLSLNASIEAARAGENGKGFAIVAQEIGTLAKESTVAANNIKDLVEQIQSASDNMSECLQMMLDFVNKTTSDNYNKIANITDLYDADANSLKNSMHTIHTSIEDLKQSVSGISSSISQINFTVADSTSGISNVSSNASDIVTLTTNTDKIAKTNGQHSQTLKEIISKFNL